MPDRVRVFASGDGPPPSRRVLIAGVVVFVIAVLAAFFIGRGTAPSSRATVQAQRPGPPTGPGPSRVVSGVGVGYPDTEAGAVAALLADGQTLSDPRVLLDPRRRAQVLSLI